MKTKLLCLLSVFFLFFPTYQNVSPETLPKHSESIRNSLPSQKKVAYVINSLSEEQTRLKRAILNEFDDVPKMAKIAYCESGYKQFDSEGNVLKSKTNDYGLFQINSDTWDKKAKEIGLDYKNSSTDNIKMARYIYERQGIGAWTCAKLI